MVARSSQFRRLTSIGPTMKASLFKPGTRKQVDVGHWFVQTIESVFGLKEADSEGTAARTPRAREGRQNGRSRRRIVNAAIHRHLLGDGSERQSRKVTFRRSAISAS